MLAGIERSTPPLTSDARDPDRSLARRPRADLAVAALDDELVVFDPRDGSSHHLAGGSVAIWLELELGGTRGLHDRVGRRVNVVVDEIRTQIDDFVRLVDEAGLLEPER